MKHTLGVFNSNQSYSFAKQWHSQCISNFKNYYLVFVSILKNITIILTTMFIFCFLKIAM